MVDYAMVSVTSTNFTSCSSEEYGGAFGWDYQSTPSNSPFFKSCRFCENTASTGADLCFRTWSADVNPFDEECASGGDPLCIPGVIVSFCH